MTKKVLQLIGYGGAAQFILGVLTNERDRMKAIEHELERLKSETWYPIIAPLIKNYQGSSVNLERWEPEFQLRQYLRRLDPGMDSLHRFIASAVSNLDCYCLRVMVTTHDGPVLWNSTQMSYRKFVFTNSAAGTVEEYTDHDAYPPRDFIRTYLQHRHQLMTCHASTV